MTVFRALLATVTLLTTMGAASAGMVIEDAYLRTATPAAKAGAIYLRIRNDGTAPDTLVAVETDVAQRAELHAHTETGGVMQMRRIEGGLTIAPGGTRVLERGGDHVMLMGLTMPLEQGQSVPVTLVFDQAGRIGIEVPVDRSR